MWPFDKKQGKLAKKNKMLTITSCTLGGLILVAGGIGVGYGVFHKSKGNDLTYDHYDITNLPYDETYFARVGTPVGSTVQLNLVDSTGKTVPNPIFDVTDLPKGLYMNYKTGSISGTIPDDTGTPTGGRWYFFHLNAYSTDAKYSHVKPYETWLFMFVIKGDYTPGDDDDLYFTNFPENMVFMNDVPIASPEKINAFDANGNMATVDFSLIKDTGDDDVPQGLSINGAEGTISGVPSGVSGLDAERTFTVQATGTAGTPWDGCTWKKKVTWHSTDKKIPNYSQYFPKDATSSDTYPWITSNAYPEPWTMFDGNQNTEKKNTSGVQDPYVLLDFSQWAGHASNTISYVRFTMYKPKYDNFEIKIMGNNNYIFDSTVNNLGTLWRIPPQEEPAYFVDYIAIIPYAYSYTPYSSLKLFIKETSHDIAVIAEIYGYN